VNTIRIGFIGLGNVGASLAGNLLRHPCFDPLREAGTGYRVSGSLAVTDELAEQAVWVGVYPGLTPADMDRTASVIRDAVTSGARHPALAAPGPA